MPTWIDRILEAIWQVPSVIGVEWNQGTDTWRRIDEYGNVVTVPAGYFDRHPVWGGMRRCTLAAAGTVNHYGANPRGDGLDLTGVDGRVMVQIPKFYVKGERPSANVYRWWISPSARPGYVVHPAFVQRGGTERAQIYVGAYDADFEYDGDNQVYNAANLKLNSRTAKQPYTGNADCIWRVDIDGLQNQPAIGNSLSTPTEAGFILVDYVKTAGAWGGGGAGDTAILWVSKPGDATIGWVDNEAITNDTLVNTLAGGAGFGVNGASAGRVITEADARTLAGNIGASWGLFNIWSLSAVQLLFYTEYASASSQTLIGQGIVNKAGGTGFAGEVNGFNSSDTNIGVNGTGSGTGVDGVTPIVYRGIENLWGNVWQFIDGYDALDAGYRIIKRTGTGVFANPIGAGDYETSLAAPIVVNGYISNIVYEDLLKYIFLAAAVAGSSATYLYDYWYAHVAAQTNILLAGGPWDSGVAAGVGFRYSSYVAAGADRTVGARLEFIG
ncbi:MAG: hypothetical protein Q8O55_07550 [Dehalococcoidales bacterium]|nr:hypothetical protein [Dehalococcoidales bacterium]